MGVLCVGGEGRGRALALETENRTSRQENHESAIDGKQGIYITGYRAIILTEAELGLGLGLGRRMRIMHYALCIMHYAFDSP